MPIIGIAFGAIVLLIVLLGLSCRRNRQLREKILLHGERLDDDEYSARMPFLKNEQEIKLALRFRTVFALIANLPRECIIPEILIDDLFDANNSIVSDGVDPAELVMEIEDELGVEIPEDAQGIRMNFIDDTVASLTDSLMQYARVHWGAILASAEGSREVRH
jgi:acyl carrier protein